MTAVAIGANSKRQLAGYFERIEALERTVKEAKEDIKAVYDEAKAEGFDDKIMKALVKIRKKGVRRALVDRDETQALIDTYLAALGWVGPDGLPANDDDTTEQQP